MTSFIAVEMSRILAGPSCAAMSRVRLSSPSDILANAIKTGRNAEVRSLNNDGRAPCIIKNSRASEGELMNCFLSIKPAISRTSIVRSGSEIFSSPKISDALRRTRRLACDLRSSFGSGDSPKAASSSLTRAEPHLSMRSASVTRRRSSLVLGITNLESSEFPALPPENMRRFQHNCCHPSSASDSPSNAASGSYKSAIR